MAKHKTPEQYLQEPYARTLIPDSESGGYTAQIEEFPGCFAEGETLEDAYKNLRSAAVSWLEAAIDMGQAIPEPFVNRTYSGNIALRLPKSLHADVVRAAEREGTSLNQFLVATISKEIGATTMRVGATTVRATITQRRNDEIADTVFRILEKDLNVHSFKISSLAGECRLNTHLHAASAISPGIKADTMKDAFMYNVSKTQGTRGHGR